MVTVKPKEGSGFEYQGVLYICTYAYRPAPGGTYNRQASWKISGPAGLWRGGSTPLHPLKQALVQIAWEMAGGLNVPIQLILPRKVHT